MKLQTIRQLCADMKKEGGASIREGTLRRLIASGQIRCVRSGNRAYVTREWVAEFLNGQTAALEAPAAPTGTIRPVK